MIRNFVAVLCVCVNGEETQIGHSIIKFCRINLQFRRSESCKQDWMKIDWIWLSFLSKIVYICV